MRQCRYGAAARPLETLRPLPYKICEETVAEGKWIAYLRVSTQRQGKSGLGLEAQRNAVTEFLNGGNWSLVKEYVEVESGKR
jgi:hypothetical protein